MLDNDIYISERAPDIFEVSDLSKITVVEESAQRPWAVETIPNYYRSFHVEPDARLPVPTKVFNMGVCVIDRRQNVLFKTLYNKWQEVVRPRFTVEEQRRKDAFYRVEADGPYLSYELQAGNKVASLPREFNFFLIPWLKRAGVRQLPFLLQSKAEQKLRGVVPDILLSAVTSRARTSFWRAANECHFLHVSASKSPLWFASKRS